MLMNQLSFIAGGGSPGSNGESRVLPIDRGFRPRLLRNFSKFDPNLERD